MQRSSELSIICYSLKGSGYFSDSILPFTFTVNAALRSERMACLMISGKHLVNLFACSRTSEVSDQKSDVRLSLTRPRPRHREIVIEEKLHVARACSVLHAAEPSSG